MTERVGEPEVELSREATGPAVDRVADVVEEILDAFGLDAEVEVTESAEAITARIDGEELGILIGRRGTTIDAVQLLCYRAAFVGDAERKRVIVDAAGYRERRQELLDRAADSAARRALDIGEPVELEPMSSSERRVVHDRLKDRPEVETYSEGDEPDRRVVVAPLLAG